MFTCTLYIGVLQATLKQWLTPLAKVSVQMLRLRLISEVSVADVKGEDKLALGCPAMGAEALVVALTFATQARRLLFGQESCSWSGS